MLYTLKPNRGSTQNRKRVARGNASGTGTTGGRGSKGQQSRAGKGRRAGFEGGQTPLIRRQPKLGGFVQPGRKEYEVINLDTLEAKLTAGSYDVAALKAHRLLTTTLPVKLLGRGALTKKLELTVHSASKSARDAIAKAGGKVHIVQ